MANLKISELPIITSALGSDVLPVVQSSTTNQISYSAFTIAAKLVGGTTGNTNTELQSIVLGGDFNQITGDTTYTNNAIVGGSFNTIKDVSGSFMGGGNDNVISSIRSAIIGGNSLLVKQNAQYAGIYGGGNNSIEEASFATIIGGENNVISGDSATLESYENSIISSSSSQILSTGSYNSIIDGVSSIIPDPLEKVVMVGTVGRTAENNQTTYTENLKTFGQYYSNTFLETGSTITLDMNNGNIQHIEVNADLDLTLNNVKNGARYTIITTTTGNYTITSKTASGFTFKVDAGFDNLGNSANHVLQLFVVNNVIYGIHTPSLT